MRGGGPVHFGMCFWGKRPDLQVKWKTGVLWWGIGVVTDEEGEEVYICVCQGCGEGSMKIGSVR